MKVIVLHGAKKHELVIPGSATVSELKDKLKALTGVAAEAQDLQMMGDSLCDEASLAEQGVQDRDKIQLVTTGATAAAAPPSAPEPEPPPTQPAERREKGARSSASSKPRSGHSRGGASPSRSRAGAGASPSGTRAGAGSSANGGRTAAGGGGGDGGALASTMQVLDGIGGRLDELEEQVKSRQAPHQELFTRVLEQLDSLDLDRRARQPRHAQDPCAHAPRLDAPRRASAV